MAKVATTELQQQIEEVRREAYAAGYAAAMQVISDATARLTPRPGSTGTAPSRRRARQVSPAARPPRARGPRPTARTRRSANRRTQRGANALIIEEILKAMAPSPVRPAEIRKALQDNGVTISFSAIHNAPRQLEARNAAERVGDSRSWRYHEATEATSPMAGTSPPSE
jgi:hypothetical protein